MQVREFFEKANQQAVDTQKLCDFLIENLMTLFVLYVRTNDQQNPFRVRGKTHGQYFVAAFTDRKAVNNVRLRQHYDVVLVEEPILSFLIQTYRSNASGLMLNPGLPSCFTISKEHLHKLIVKYAVDQLSKMSGAWIPTKNEHMLLVEYKKGIYTVAIYSRKEDAELMCREAGGMPVLHPWKDVFERAKRVRAQSLFLHFHLPEQDYLSERYLEKLWKGSHQGFREQKPVTHPYHVQLIEEESSPSTSTPESDPEALEKTEPKTEVESTQPEETKSAQDPADLNEQKEHLEEDEKKHYPSERVNPYSIKNKKEQELEIYRGGQVIEEPLELFQPKSEKKEEEKPDNHVFTEPVKKSKRPSSQKVEKEIRPVKKIGNVGIPEDVRIGLERLEKATIEGQGMANGWEVCQVLAEIRRIWIIVDQQENMVILAGQDQSPIVDFFTSDVYAQRLIDEAHQNNPNLPSMSPQLVSTKKLYRALAPRHPIVWINRGSAGAWTSVMGDTLPYVLQLMAQLQR